MQPQPWPEGPAGTAKIARRAFRKGSLAMRARDELGAWCSDEGFHGLYGTRGAPGISPAQLAMVTVLQFTEDLTDRQAADAVRGRLDWKYCLGLELDDEGFDFSVLSEFRSRLVAGAMEAALLEALLARAGEQSALADAEEANKLASAIAIQNINYKEVRAKREEIKALIAKLKSGSAA